MDDKTHILIALGAAAAVNCLPCSEHIMAAASAAGVTTQEMEEAWKISHKVKSGADEVTQSWLKEQVTGQSPAPMSCSCLPKPGQASRGAEGNCGQAAGADPGQGRCCA